VPGLPARDAARRQTSNVAFLQFAWGDSIADRTGFCYS